MKKLCIVFILFNSLQAVAQGNEPIRINVSQLSNRIGGDHDYISDGFFSYPPTTCNGLRRLQKKASALNVKLLWKRCISGTVRIGHTTQAAYIENKDYNANDVSDFTIREESASSDERTMGYYILKQGIDNTVVKQSAVLGGKSSRPGFYVMGGGYKPKHFKRQKELMDLIRTAVQIKNSN